MPTDKELIKSFLTDRNSVLRVELYLESLSVDKDDDYDGEDTGSCWNYPGSPYADDEGFPLDDIDD